MKTIDLESVPLEELKLEICRREIQEREKKLREDVAAIMLAFGDGRIQSIEKTEHTYGKCVLGTVYRIVVGQI